MAPPSPKTQSLILPQLRALLGTTLDLDSGVLWPDPLSDAQSDLHASCSCPSLNGPGYLAFSAWTMSIQSLCKRMQNLCPQRPLQLGCLSAKAGTRTHCPPASETSTFHGLSPAQAPVGDGRPGLCSLWGSAGPKSQGRTSGGQPGPNDEESCFVPAIPPTYCVTLGQLTSPL